MAANKSGLQMAWVLTLPGASVSSFRDHMHQSRKGYAWSPMATQDTAGST
jgi:hypothetical protein